MFKSLLFTTAVLGALTGLGGTAALAGSGEGPDSIYRHHAQGHGAGRLPPVSGIVHLGGGPAVYDVGRGYGHQPRHAYAGWRDHVRQARVVYGAGHGHYGYGYGYGEPEAPLLPSRGFHHVTGAYGAFGTDVGYGGDGYAIPPAGGLAVYSPGAYGPGPRIIHIPGGWGVSSQQWGCGCGAHHAEF